MTPTIRVAILAIPGNPEKHPGFRVNSRLKLATTRELRGKRRLAEELEIDWFRSEDLVLGFCSVAGNQGVYRFWLDHSDEWQFCPSETKNWDYYHQMIYRSCRGDACKFSDIADQVPSLPAEFPPPDKYHVKDRSEKSLLDALPGGELVGWVRRVLPGNRLFKKICVAPEGRLPVYVVLREDLYETAFGDGVFRDFESAHLDEEAAKAFIQQQPPGMTIQSYDPPETRSVPDNRYIRKVYLTESGWTLALDTTDCDLSPYDHFTKKEIVRDLKHPEKRLDPWGEPYQGTGTADEVGTKRHE